MSVAAAPSSVPASEPPLLQSAESSSSGTAIGQFDLSWDDSGALRNSDACTPEMKTSHDVENPKESESPRVTSAPRKRFPGDIKSFSHELNSKGVRPYPFWKPKRLNNLEEVLVMIRTKFDKAKEEVDSDLCIFAADLVGILEKNAENHPEWQETIEDLLVLAWRCAMTSPGEFWLQCESIVQELDDRREELPMGMLKRLHSQMLFILTRCTRLLQFHEGSGLAEDEHFWRRLQSFSQEYGQVHRDGANQSAINEAELAASEEVPELDSQTMPKHHEEGDTLHMEEDHSRVCAIPDLRVNERLTRIKDTLEKLMGSFPTKDMRRAGSPDGAKVSSNWSVNKELELLSPKVLHPTSSCENRTVIHNQEAEVCRNWSF